MISENYSLQEFCNHVMQRDQMKVMDLICAEIHSVRVNYLRRTGTPDLIEGSKEDLYCEDLQKLLSILMNAALPPKTKSCFLQAIYPLIAKLSQENILLNKILLAIIKDRLIADTFKNAGENVSASLENRARGILLVLTSSKSDIEKQHTSEMFESLDLLVNPKVASEFLERVDIMISGYDSDKKELCEIKEVRDWALLLDEHFPYWFFFLSKFHRGLQFITFSLCNYKKNHDGSLFLIKDLTLKYFFERHFTALNKMCALIALPDRDVDVLTNRVVNYYNR